MAEKIKHIKRKFQGQRSDAAAFEAVQREGEASDVESIGKSRIKKDRTPWLVTDDNSIIPCFVHKMNGRDYVIPEPDPILIYFNNAQTNFRNIEDAKNDVLKSLDYSNNRSVSDIAHSLYDFMYQSTGFVIFLFTAIEAVINKTIPEDFVHRVDNKQKRCTEEYNFEQIQRQLSFDIKVKEILPKVSKKDFTKTHSTSWSHINNLKKLRDVIIHTKRQADAHTPYSDMFKNALSFNYSAAIVAVRDFINYYQPGLVEPCPCGKDF